MAIKATIYKAELEIVDLDRHVYETYPLTLARHPSENDERLMVRLLAFGLNAAERLEFGKGVSDSGEPDLWRKDLTGDIELWIELGHPDPKILAKALGRSGLVRVYAYSARPEIWWKPIERDFAMARNLEVYAVDAAAAAALAGLAGKTMALQLSVQDGDVTVRSDTGAEVPVPIVKLR
jgi:uncharacterized protein YaeQ